jgi:Peptidase family M28/PDZ domain
MRFKSNSFLFFTAIAFLYFNSSSAQSPANLKKHISFLASDSLHGRMTGSDDEHKAANYIIDAFKKEGVENTYGDFDAKNYLEPFHFDPTVDSVKSHISGTNVVAFINNHAPFTVVIGAHYDHLGMGDPKYSLYTGPAAVHHGADDNASGVASLLELAGLLKDTAYKNNNYLFIAFSGEELGLYGSKWFVQHPAIPLDKINYMINLDMVGRVDSTTRVLTVNGIGTSPAFKDAVAKVQTPLHIKTTESGIGPSDHTSFYLQNIPVIFLFTGQHKDYHKPSDTEDKINYSGMVDVLNYTISLIAELNTKGRLGFTKTKDDNVDSAPKFKVTLGVIPDYTYDGEGLRIDAVKDDRPAAKAGLKNGDVVIQLGDIKVTEMNSYMKALGKFNKSDKTKVKVKRGNEVIEKEIEF